MKILLLSVLTIAMIGVMAPSVSGQVQVTVTPFVDSWKIGEINYLDISVSKIVPNTNFCIKYIFDDGDEKIWSTSRSPDFSENIYRHPLGGLYVLPPNTISYYPEYEKYGEIDITVIYGTCDGENFGTATTTINRVNELEPITEFMMKNYSIESIDVGTSWSIKEPDGEGITSGIRYITTESSPDATFKQKFNGVFMQDSHLIVVYSNEGFGEITLHESDETYKDFECFTKRWNNGPSTIVTTTNCANDNFLIEYEEKPSKSRDNLSSSTFIPSVIDKIHSNPINPIIEEKIEASPTYSYEPTHVSNFPDPSKSPQHYLDRYNNEDVYRDWFNSQFPDRTIHEVLGLPEPTTQKIPDWVKNIFTWYSQDQISEDEVLIAIKFLVNQGIIDLDK